MDPLIQRELSKLDPTVPFRPRLYHLHHTWARTFYSQPEFYFQPECLAELQKIVTLARRCRKRVVVVGSGHSPSDLTCSSSWMVNLDKLDKIVSTRHDEITVQAGIRLSKLGEELDKLGAAMPNLGSIDDQSVAGAIATGTHGSSLYHGLLSQSITSLKIMLSNGQIVSCTSEKNNSLFRAALISLGALGILVEVSLRSVPAFNLHWEQTLRTLPSVLSDWDTTLWSSHEFVRVWWMPYLDRAIVWSADKTDLPLRSPPSNFYGGRLGYYIYHTLLTVSHYIPRLLPAVEWFVFGMQYGFRPGPHTSVSAVEESREALLMNCLYSQFVNEWAIPLSKGPEAITRLSAWIHGDPERARIPYPSDVYVHCPVEVRVSDTTPFQPQANSSPSLNPNSTSNRPYLDPTDPTGPTLYLNATLYRPYNLDPPCTNRYYQAFEYLMKDLGGRPHWAKNFTTVTHKDIEAMYGDDLKSFNTVRAECDPEGMFIGEFHRRTILSPAPTSSAYHPLSSDASASPFLALEEAEFERKPFPKGGILWTGQRRSEDDLPLPSPSLEKRDIKVFESRSSSPRTPTTGASDESFDVLAKGEASVYHLGHHGTEAEEAG